MSTASMDRAVALEVEVQRRQQLLTQLLEVTTHLAQARTRTDVVRAMMERAVGPLDAFAVAMWMLAPDGTHLELLDASDSERAVAVARYQQVPLSSDMPVAAAVRTGETIYLRSLDEYAAKFPASRARLEPVLHESHRAFAVIPFGAGVAPLGAMVFTFASERTFTEPETTYMMLLARHCGLALARVQLLTQEREQRETMELLYELIASFNRFDDIDAVYELALGSVLRVSRCDRAAILLYDHANVMRFRAHVGLSETYRAAVDGHSPWQPDALFPPPIAISDIETDPSWVDHRPVFRAEGIRALAFVPIVHQRKLIGKFMLYRNAPRPFAARDLQLTATVAVHVAQAVERKQQERELARAYREEREAHLLAEEAARAREEILSVVSHDLRNPLGTIMMAASTLQSIQSNDTRVQTTSERITRQAQRMARMIEGLVDFAAIQAGQIDLDRGHHLPHAILTTAGEIFGPIASERGLRFETEVLGNLPVVECDSDRAVQVLSNLVSNALKVTPKGGAIAIGAQPKASEIVFYVRDTGPGIEPDELPTIFERQWRGKQSTYRGTGLGLAIARGIVDAHGGRIWAESQLGIGSTFYFSLSPSS